MPVPTPQPAPRSGRTGGLGALLRRGRRPARRLVLLTRAGCHLCEDLHRLVLAETAQRADVTLEVVDLDEAAAARQDPALLERWSDAVPVLLLDGREVARWRVEPAELREILGRG